MIMIEKIVSEFVEPSLCKCGCGCKVSIFRGKTRKFIKGHGRRGIHNSEEHKRNQRHPKNVRWSEESKIKKSEQVKEYYRLHPEQREIISRTTKEKTPRGKEHPCYDSECHKTPEEIVKELGEPPFCGCNCGNKVDVRSVKYAYYKRKGYDKFISGHQTRKGNHPNYGKPAPKGSGCGKGDYHLTPNQGIVWMRSSWELAYAKYLEKNNIDYWFEVYGFKMNIGFDTIYHPDFFLPSQNKFIEVKGRDNYNSWEDTDVSKLKSDKFKSDFCKYWNYEVLFGEDLLKLKIDL